MHSLQFNSRAVGGLHSEALVLMNEARHVFAAFQPGDEGRLPTDELKALVLRAERDAIELMVNALTWLRDQQAHLEGRLSWFRLRLRRLPRAGAAMQPEELALLPQSSKELVTAIARFYRRLHIIESHWRPHKNGSGDALARLRSRRVARGWGPD